MKAPPLASFRDGRQRTNPEALLRSSRGGSPRIPPAGWRRRTVSRLGLLLVLALPPLHAASGTVVAWGLNGQGQTTVPAGAQSGITAIAAGFRHTLALRNDGAVGAWGYNVQGQTKVPAIAQSGVLAVAVGGSDDTGKGGHSVALKTDGSVVAWGDNSFGQTTVPTAAKSGVMAIAAGFRHTVALKGDGTVLGWGDNLDGQTSAPRDLREVTAIAAGDYFTVALRPDGSVVAWGSNKHGATTIPIAAQVGVTAIASGYEHVVALKVDGSVAAWGDNSFGQTTVPAAAQSGIIAVAAGFKHSVGLKSDGTLVTWGNNAEGQLTVPSTAKSGVTAIAAGGFHSVALLGTGALAPAISVPPASQNASVGQNVTFVVTASGTPPLHYQWRRNAEDLAGATGASHTLTAVQSEQAGSYTVTVSNVAGKVLSAPAAVLTVYPTNGTVVVWGSPVFDLTNVPVAARSGVTALAMGGNHAVALRNDGTVVAWGSNSDGQTTVPKGLTDVIAIAAGGNNFSLALKGDGSVVAWGLNASGQTTVPANLRTGGGAVATAIAAGYDHAAAVLRDGSLATWGNLGSKSELAVPSGLKDVQGIASGSGFTLALKSDATVVAWGNNRPFPGPTNVPTGLKEVVAIAAGGFHAAALKGDGTVVAWGFNERGQTDVPADLAGVTVIAAGAEFTAALKSDGTIVTWGDNCCAQRDVPAGLFGVTAISAGSSDTGVVVGTGAPTGILTVSPNLTAPGRWSARSSWSPRWVPDNTTIAHYRVVWNANPSTLSLDRNFTVDSLDLSSGGILAGDPKAEILTLAVQDTSTWSGGSIEDLQLILQGLTLTGSKPCRLNRSQLVLSDLCTIQSGSLALAGGALVTVNRAGVLDLKEGTLVTAPSPDTGEQIINYGALGKFASGGVSGIQCPVHNHGLLRVTQGILQLKSTFEQDGVVEILEHAALQSELPLNLERGLLRGDGTLVGPVTAGGVIQPGTDGSVGQLTFTSSLTLDPASTLSMDADLKENPSADRVLVQNTLTLRGSLRLSLPHGGIGLAGSGPLVIAQAALVTGQFRNVPPGGRLMTTDGSGSFQVDYEGSHGTSLAAVWLSDFRASPAQPIPVAKLPYLIVYGREGSPTGGAPDVWLASADGSLDVRLGAGQNPRFSPDRSRIGFVRPNKIPSSQDIWVRHLASGLEQPWVVAAKADELIAGFDFVAAGDGMVYDQNCVISFQPFSGSPTVFFSNPDACNYRAPAVRPGTAQVVVHHRDQGLVILGAAINPLKVPNSQPGDLWPAWSANGSRLAFLHDSDLLGMGVDGSGRKSLLAASKRTVTARGQPAWTPDGQYVVAPLTVDGQDGLFVVAANGSGGLARLAVDANGWPPNHVGSVVALEPFPAVAWSTQIGYPGIDGLLANPLDLKTNTLEGWLGGSLNLPLAGILLENERGGQTMSIRKSPGRWTPDLPVPPGIGGYLSNGQPASVVVTGWLAHPAQRGVITAGPHLYGARSPQVADFETMLGFPPPEGTTVTRSAGITGGAGFESLVFKNGEWHELLAPQPATVPPVAVIGEGWRVELGGPGLFAPPENQRVFLGDPASFHVATAGAPPFSYRWMKAGDTGRVLSTSDTLTLAAVRPGDLGTYYVEVTDQAGTTTSQPARLIADGSLRIVTNPVPPGKPVPPGTTVTLSVTALGSGDLSYQWFRNGRPLPGETADTLVLPLLTPTDAGRFSVRVHDSFSTVFSAAAPVIPEVPVLPFSDAFLGGIEAGANFTNQIPGNNGMGRGQNADATAEPGEPDHAGLPARNSVWLSWVPTASGVAAIDTLGSSFDTRLAIYTTNAPGVLSVKNLRLVTEDDDADVGVRTARASFNAAAGTRYFIAVDGGGRDRGGILLSWSLEATSQRIPEISRQAVSQNLGFNQTLKLLIEAAIEPGTRQIFSWFRNGLPVPGGLDGTLDLGVPGEDQVGKYSTEIRQVYPDGSARLVRSVIAEIQLSHRSNGSDSALRAFDRLTDVLQQLGRPRLRDADAAGSGHRLGLSHGVSGTQVFTTAGESVDPAEPIHCGVPGGASKWYPLNCDTDGVVTLDTAGSSFDTVLAVYYDTGLGTDVYDGLRAVECNNDASPTNTTSALSFCASAGTVYLVAVDGVGGATGKAKLNYQMAAPPASVCPGPGISCPLRRSQRVATQGSTIDLHADVSGTEPLTLSWFRNGILVQSDASTTLTLPNVTATAAGNYSLRVTNADGQAEQVVAQLAVVIDDRALLGYEENCDGSLNFAVAGAKNVEYVFESSTDLQSWTPLFSGSSPTGLMELPVLNPQETQGKTYRARKK